MVDTPADDGELVARLKTGSAVAAGDLFALHFLPLVRYGRERGMDMALVEDVATETLVRTWLKIRDGAIEPRVLGSYLRRSMANRYTDEIRRAKLLDDHLQRVGPTVTDQQDPAETVVEIEAVAHALNRLPIRYREALRLAVVEDRDPSEVAQLMGLPSLNAVHVLTHRARRALQGAYASNNYADVTRE